jgi:hypothetical protein
MVEPVLVIVVLPKTAKLAAAPNDGAVTAADTGATTKIPATSTDNITAAPKKGLRCF